MSTNDDEVHKKQQLLRELLQRQREIDAQSLPQAAPAISMPMPAPSVGRAIDRPIKAPRYKTRPPRQAAAVARNTPVARGFDTSVIDGATMDRIGVGFVRGAAFVLLGVGIFGSILAFDGDWTPSWRFWETLSPLAALAGIGLQIEITIVEWWRARKPGFDLAYWLHLLLDAGLMLWGWWPIVGVLIAQTIERAVRRSESLAMVATWANVVTFAALAIVAFLIARQPERWLVRR